jgi:hypothetical protein
MSIDEGIYLYSFDSTRQWELITVNRESFPKIPDLTGTQNGHTEILVRSSPVKSFQAIDQVFGHANSAC